MLLRMPSVVADATTAWPRPLEDRQLLVSGWLFSAYDGGAPGLTATLIASAVAVVAAAGSLYPAARRPA